MRVRSKIKFWVSVSVENKRVGRALLAAHSKARPIRLEWGHLLGHLSDTVLLVGPKRAFRLGWAGLGWVGLTLEF